MKSQWHGFQSTLGPDIKQFVAYKRNLRRRYDCEEKALRMLDAFLVARNVGSIDAITPEMLLAFPRFPAAPAST
jgi:hypothetical protein